MSAYHTIIPNGKAKRQYRYKVNIDEVQTFKIDTAIIDQELGVTTSAVTWSTDDSNISLGSSAFASGIGSVPVTANSVGLAKLKLSLTTSGSDAPIYYIDLDVQDPEDVPGSIWR